MKAPSAAPAGSRIATLPNALSALRLASVPVFLYLWSAGRRDAAFVLYAVGAVSDFLDGYIARHTSSITELGKILDPLADRVFIVALAIALVAAGTFPWPLAAVIVLRDVVILSAYPLVRRRGIERIEVNFVGKCATAALLVGLSALALSETSFPWGAVGDEVGVIVVALGALLYWVAAFTYAAEAIRRVRSQERAA